MKAKISYIIESCRFNSKDNSKDNCKDIGFNIDLPISNKFYVKENKEETKKYISYFTLYNFIGLFIFGVIFML